MLPASCSVTRKRLNIKHLAKIRVVVFATLILAILLSINALRAAPKCAALTSPPSFSHSCLSLHAFACHSTLLPATPRSRQSLYARICHSTLPPVTPTCSPLSPLHAHRRYPHAHIEAQPELGIAPWLQLDFVDIWHSGERPLGCFPVPAFESLFDRTERRSCECGSGAAE